MSWRQFVMNLESIDPHIAELALADLGAQAITLTDAGDNPVLEPGPGETPLWQETRITALFAEGTDVSELRERLRTLLNIKELPTNHTEVLEDRIWEREWLKDFAPMHFGQRLWIAPDGMEVIDDNAIVVELDPGLAFGTGTHPTTAMCLEWLAQNDIRGKRVLDFGCGSGILSIAALKLGAEAVRAVDIDLQAVTATRQNARKNGVDSQLRVGTELDRDSQPFDIVIANILADTLIDQAAPICQKLKAGGSLILSGILSEQAKEVGAAYEGKVELAAPVRLDDWVRLAGVRH